MAFCSGRFFFLYPEPNCDLYNNDLTLVTLHLIAFPWSCWCKIAAWIVETENQVRYPIESIIFTYGLYPGKTHEYSIWIKITATGKIALGGSRSRKRTISEIKISLAWDGLRHVILTRKHHCYCVCTTCGAPTILMGLQVSWSWSHIVFNVLLPFSYTGCQQ